MTTELNALEPIHNQILFRFIEDTTKGRFNQQSSGGILIVDRADKQVDYARWARVLAVGPDAVGDEYEVNDIVLIAPLRWTNSFKHKDKSYWITTDADVLAVLDDEANAPGEIKHFL